MSFDPDYGKYLVEQGYTRDTDLFFYDFHMYSIALIGPGHYSVTASKSSDNIYYALTLDFNLTHLEKILSKASPDISSTIIDELKHDNVTPRAIEFEGKVIFGVRANLGKLQNSKYESFVPLIAKEIF